MVESCAWMDDASRIMQVIFARNLPKVTNDYFHKYTNHCVLLFTIYDQFLYQAKITILFPKYVIHGSAYIIIHRES